MKTLVSLIFLLHFVVSAHAQIDNQPQRQNEIQLMVPLETSPDDAFWDRGFGPPLNENSDVKSVTTSGSDVYAIYETRILIFNSQTGFWNFIDMYNSGTVNFLKAKYGKLYAGGNFENYSGKKAKSIAVWNGIKWDTLGKCPEGKVFAIDADEDGTVYVGGEFSTNGDSSLSNIAYWNGSTWNPMGEGVDGKVRAIYSDGLYVYVAGDFFTADGKTANKIAQWNKLTHEWKTFGNGISDEMNSRVYTIGVLQSGKIVAGGMFSKAGGTDANNVAIYNGKDWEALGDGFNDAVFSICISNDKIYASGAFSKSGENVLNRIAVWNGKQWNDVENGVGNSQYPNISSIAGDDAGNIYAGGSFLKAGNVSCSGFAKFDGTEWQDLFKDNKNGVRTLISDFVVGSSNNYLFAGGGFVQTGDANSIGISKFDGTKWLGCNVGLAPSADVVYSMQAVGEDVYFTGWFNKADNTMLNNVAKWKDNDKTWEPIGKGIDGGDGTLGPIAVDGNNVYVGGQFSFSGGIQLNSLAWYDGKTWNPVMRDSFVGVVMKNGNTGSVDALAMDNDKKLYIGGRFNKAGNVDADNIAIYDTKTGLFSPISSGINGTVYKIAIFGDSVFFCGSFSAANGDTSLRNIAIWNKTTNQWLGVGGTLNGAVSTVVKWFDDLYIGGSFTKAGGIDCFGVAKLNGITGKYEALGTGLRQGLSPGRASALIIYKNALYVGGMFLSAGGKVAANFSRWSNIRTHVIESNTNSLENGLTVSPNPATDFIEISVGSRPSLTNTDIRIFNVFGEIVSTSVCSADTSAGGGQRIDVSGLPFGVYFMRVGDKIGKFVKI